MAKTMEEKVKGVVVPDPLDMTVKEMCRLIDMAKAGNYYEAFSMAFTYGYVQGGKGTRADILTVAK